MFQSSQRRNGGIWNNSFIKKLEWNRPTGETTIKKTHHAIYLKWWQVVWKW